MEKKQIQGNKHPKIKQESINNMSKNKNRTNQLRQFQNFQKENKSIKKTATNPNRKETNSEYLRNPKYKEMN